MNIKVASSIARGKLPELLRGVVLGKRYTITLRGVAVADLVPVQDRNHSEVVVAVDDMLAFMEAQKSLSGIDLKSQIDEGRA